MSTLLEKIRKEGDKLINYLFHFGEADFQMPDFSPDNFNYARISIITTQPIFDGIIERINERLSQRNGYSMMLREIEWEKRKKEKFRYRVEITPRDNRDYNPERLEKMTEYFLRSLPKEILNITKMRCRDIHKKTKLKC